MHASYGHLKDLKSEIYILLVHILTEESKMIEIMATNNSTDTSVCIVDKTGTFQIILVFLVMPFHAFIVKILAMDFQFELPRHKILFSLSLSDATQISGLFISALINKAVTLTIGSTGCMVYRGFTIFIACSTMVVSCISIFAMSVERYIACIHSFRIHEILTELRVRNGTIFAWVLGVVAGLLAASINHYDAALIIPIHSATQYTYLICVIPTSVVATVIQVRLFIFSRTKINRVNSTGAFGEELELADYRKKHIKVAFMAGIVAFSFIACTTPLAFVFLYELLSGAHVSTTYRSVFLSLSFMNNFADPFIYDLGYADIRKKMTRDLKKSKKFLLEMLPENVCNVA